SEERGVCQDSRKSKGGGAAQAGPAAKGLGRGAAADPGPAEHGAGEANEAGPRGLDWIVMKCLEKERNRRYETASGIAADVKRYLADEPVQACPPSVSYRFGKFARRNKRALATAALLGVILLVAVGAVVASARRAAG